MKSVALAVDLGGTDIKAGLIDSEGDLLDDFRIPTGNDLSADAVAAKLVDVIAKLETKATDRGYSPIGIGVGVPGAVYEDRATISQAPNFPLWRDIPMKLLIGKQIDLPVLLDNDANLAALGESWMGAGRDVESMILFTLGTGIGGGIILDGNIWRGAWGMAGEIGHITVEKNGPRCGCGNNGCLEALVAKMAIINSAKAIVAEGQSPILEALIKGDSEQITPKTVFNAAQVGCPASLHLFQKMGEYIGIVCASLLNVLCVEKFVLGGGMSEAYEFINKAVLKEIHQRAYRIPAERVLVEKAQLGNHAGLLGAGKMALGKAANSVQTG